MVRSRKSASPEDVKQILRVLLKVLKKKYPTVKSALNYSNPLEVLIASILSAQCTDKRVNMVTSKLFAKYKTARDYAEADLDELKTLIRSTGFYNNKAKNIKAAGKKLVENFDGKVPKTIDELITLPGVARKIANVVLFSAYGLSEGIAIDTHVGRIVQRLGLTENKDPKKIEKDLMEILEKKDYGRFSLMLVEFGREICQSRKPDCEGCPMKEICPSALREIFDKSFLNVVQIDEFNMTHGVFAVNKKQGMTSHDVVNIVRRKLRTRKVGHAGALDPFATGVLIILVGRYTKMSEMFLHYDKEYTGKILLGISTDTQDPDGKILEISDKKLENFDTAFLNEKLRTISKGYEQRVPVFSSVKVGGQKLRKLAHQADLIDIENGSAIFTFKDGKKKTIELPKREVKFSKFEISNLKEMNFQSLTKGVKEGHNGGHKDSPKTFQTFDLSVGCSKGTYIRQLAVDIGEILGQPSMLASLERTKLHDISLSDCVDVDEIQDY